MLNYISNKYGLKIYDLAQIIPCKYRFIDAQTDIYIKHELYLFYKYLLFLIKLTYKAYFLKLRT